MSLSHTEGGNGYEMLAITCGRSNKSFHFKVVVVSSNTEMRRPNLQKCQEITRWMGTQEVISFSKHVAP